MGVEIYWLIKTIIDLFVFVVFVYIILSWLIQFSVINANNQVVATVIRIARGVVEPALRPIQRVVPLIGGLDVSPIVMLIGLEFIKRILYRVLVTGF